MHFIGVVMLIIASIMWIFGGRAIMRPRLHRPRGQSLMSILRPSPVSFKDFPPNQKRNLVWLILTVVALVLLGLGLIEGAFD
jgi:hypothetical protein